MGIEIRNLALLTYSASGALDYGRSRIFVEAPLGPYDWLNSRVFVGTLEVIRPYEEVLIRSFVLELGSPPPETSPREVAPESRNDTETPCRGKAGRQTGPLGPVQAGPVRDRRFVPTVQPLPRD